MTDWKAWLEQVQEEIIEPERPIIDPHHHFWKHREPNYLLDDLWRDTGSGHNIEKTVFVECGAEYRTKGEEAFKPLGETEFVKPIAEASQKGPSGAARVEAIVGHVDLRIGGRAGEVLDAHMEIAPDLFKGIRHSGAWDPDDEVRTSHSNPSENLYAEPAFREGFRELAKRGMSFDAWNYHHTIPKLTELARANPDVPIILDHFGGPAGIGRYKDLREEIFDQWKIDVAELARCENVVAKLGGMAMPLNGFGWHDRATPATSEELEAAQGRYYHHMIDVFGPDRCMFESNFPVDKFSISYPVLWNALKKIASNYSEDEKHAMFFGTAARVYRL